MEKKIIFYIHSVAGLVTGFFILIMSLSGTALVFHDELDSIQFPRINNPAATVLPVDSCYRGVQQQFSHAQISSCILPDDPTRPFLFSIYDASYRQGTASLQVFVHPATGAVLQTRGSKDIKNNFMNWVAVLHNSFHLGKAGEWLLGFFSIVFLLSITTGIIIYRKKIWPALLFRKEVFNKRNFHQLIGVYALLFNLMIGITGFWMQRYVFKKTFYATDNYTPVLKASPGLLFDVDAAYKMAIQQYPDFTGHVIYFGQTKKSKTAIYGSRSSNSFIHSKIYVDVILLDSTGKVATTAFVNDIDADSRYDIINAQVHYGQYGGWPLKLIYGLFGLCSGLLSITGFLLWRKRKKRNTIE